MIIIIVSSITGCDFGSNSYGEKIEESTENPTLESSTLGDVTDTEDTESDKQQETTNSAEIPTESQTEPNTGPSCNEHVDIDDNGKCDNCFVSVIVFIDFYTINDLHGKFNDNVSNIGVDELTAYLKNTALTDDNTVFLSSGDMWQGSS